MHDKEERTSCPARVRVGVGCFVTCKANNAVYFLIGERRGSHGDSTWGLPGGHLEMGESWSACAQREVAEECGIQIGPCQHVATTNDIFDPATLHYITLFVKHALPTSDTSRKGGSRASLPRVSLMEPEKCARWIWITWSELANKAAVLRDACVPNTCEDFANGPAPGMPVNLSALFLPLVNLEKQYGAQGPPWLDHSLC
ncbi:hypothetical protein GGI07_005459 [Coemansia sp. Benny D115]|nr:hypothetical protein GGI07_005459 [Coemansia sp. Benny D115]